MVCVNNHRPRFLGDGWHRVPCVHSSPSLPEVLASDAINIARISGAPAQLRRKLPVQATIILGAHAMTVTMNQAVHPRGNVHPASAEPEAARSLTVPTATVTATAHVALSRKSEADSYHRVR